MDTGVANALKGGQNCALGRKKVAGVAKGQVGNLKPGVCKGFIKVVAAGSKRRGLFEFAD